VLSPPRGSLAVHSQSNAVVSNVLFTAVSVLSGLQSTPRIEVSLIVEAFCLALQSHSSLSYRLCGILQNRRSSRWLVCELLLRLLLPQSGSLFLEIFEIAEFRVCTFGNILLFYVVLRVIL